MKLDLQTKRDLRLLAAALMTAIVLALITWLVLPPPQTGGAPEQLSTFFNSPYGTKAAYLVLEQLGYNVRRLRRPVDTDTLEGLEALVLLRPVYCLSEYEAGVLSDWVWEGHSLLVSPAAETETPWSDEQCSGPKAWFHYAEGDAPSEEAGERRISSPRTIRLPEGMYELAASDANRFDAERPLVWPAEDLPVRVLWEDELGVVAFETSFGDGRIIALADVYGLTNEGLGESDHAVWLAGLAATLTKQDPATRLAFDEYHAGFPHQPDLWPAVARLLWGGRWSWAVTQALFVGALALLGAGARFGRPEHVAPVRRRTQGEFTQAAGRFLRAARARDVAVATLTGYYRERLCHALHLPPGTAEADLAEALRRRGWPQWADLVLQATKGRGPIGESELLRLTQRLETILEALEHGAGEDDGTRAAPTHRAG